MHGGETDFFSRWRARRWGRGHNTERHKNGKSSKISVHHDQTPHHRRKEEVKKTKNSVIHIQVWIYVEINWQILGGTPTMSRPATELHDVKPVDNNIQHVCETEHTLNRGYDGTFLHDWPSFVWDDVKPAAMNRTVTHVSPPQKCSYTSGWAATNVIRQLGRIVFPLLYFQLQLLLLWFGVR